MAATTVLRSIGSDVQQTEREPMLESLWQLGDLGGQQQVQRPQQEDDRHADDGADHAPHSIVVRVTMPMAAARSGIFMSGLLLNIVSFNHSMSTML